MEDDSTRFPFSSARLDQYLAGELSEDDRAPIDGWLAVDPSRRAWLEGREVPASVRQADWQRVLGAVEVPGHRPVAGMRRPESPHRSWRTGVGAALVAVAAVATIGLLKTAPKANVSVAHVYTTGPGEQTNISLGDGSHVVLAPRSRLTILTGFGKNTRSVALAGEAHFTVSHAGGIPFVVTTKSAATRVLGTQFDVRQYTDQSQTEVAVMAGKVVARASGGEVTLTAGTLGTLGDSVASQRSADMRPYEVWTTGSLMFKNVPVASMLATVGRWYDLEFRVTDSALVAQHVTTLLSVKNREETMRVLEDLLDVSIAYEGSTVVLRPARAAARSAPSRLSRPRAFIPRNEVGR